MPPSLAKCGVDCGCQSWVATTMAPALVGRLDLARRRRDDRVTAGHAQAAGGIGEIVLDVDDDEGRARADSAACAERSAVAPAADPEGRTYPMRADCSSGTTGATVSGGTGGSTSSR